MKLKSMDSGFEEVAASQLDGERCLRETCLYAQADDILQAMGLNLEDRRVAEQAEDVKQQIIYLNKQKNLFSQKASNSNKGSNSNREMKHQTAGATAELSEAVLKYGRLPYTFGSSSA